MVGIRSTALGVASSSYSPRLDRRESVSLPTWAILSGSLSSVYVNIIACVIEIYILLLYRLHFR